MSGGLYTIFGILIGVFVTLYVHSLDRRDKYLFSLIKEKFAAAQQAYLYSLKLKNVIHGDEQIRGDTLSKIQKWFDENCLYLSTDIRDDFKDTLWNTWFYQDQLQGYYELKKLDDKQKVDLAWNDLRRNFDKIIQLDKRIAASLNIYYEYENTFKISKIWARFRK